VSKNNTGSLPLRGNPAGKQTNTTDLWWYVHKIHLSVVFVFLVRQVESEDVVGGQHI